MVLAPELLPSTSTGQFSIAGLGFALVVVGLLLLLRSRHRRAQVA
jgi:LPXTG-motif cell wall-anchored protein